MTTTVERAEELPAREKLPKLNRRSGHVRPGGRAYRERQQRAAARRVKAAR